MSFTEGSKNFRQLDRHTYREDAAQNFHAGIKSSDAKAIDVWLQGTNSWCGMAMVALERRHAEI